MASARVLPIPQPDRAALIDEYGELDRQVARFAPLAKRHRELQDTIRGWHQSEPADRDFMLSGTLYDVIVGMCGEERHFDAKAKLALLKLLGKARAMQVFSITLKAVTNELGEYEVTRLATKARTGSRKLTAVLREQAA